MVPWLDQSLEEISSLVVSEWVLNTIEHVNEALGLSFEDPKHLAWELFAELEKRASPLQGQGVNMKQGKGRSFPGS